MQINPQIFHSYDIRGVFGEEFRVEDVEIIAKSLAVFFKKNNLNKIFVGADNRISSPQILEIVLKILVESGCEVINLNTTLTPFIYYSWHKLDANACVMITASHNPSKYNGFKLSMNKKPLLDPDYKEILSICEKNGFVSGNGSLSNYDIFSDYIKEISQNIKLNKKLKVALDCANGTVGLFAGRLLKELGCEIIEVFCESDGSFPNHQPYPQKFQLYSVLKEKIIDEKCDVGLTFDGDGDRLGVYDEKGNFVQNDRLAMLFARDICQKNNNVKIVMNVSTSISVIDFIKSLNAEFILWKTGYPLITEKMKETGAIFGGEISGHFFFKDRYYGFDDALYAGIRILEILSNIQNSFSNEISGFPKYFETSEYRVEIPPELNRFLIIPEIAQKIKNDYPDCEILLIDGIRFSFKDSWGLIRGSNTEPLLTGRAEGKTIEALENIKKIIQNCLLAYKIELDWNLFK